MTWSALARVSLSVHLTRGRPRGGNNYGCHTSVEKFTKALRAVPAAKSKFQAGDIVSGEVLPVADPRLTTIEFHIVSHLLSVLGNVTLVDSLE